MPRTGSSGEVSPARKRLHVLKLWFNRGGRFVPGIRGWMKGRIKRWQEEVDREDPRKNR